MWKKCFRCFESCIWVKMGDIRQLLLLFSHEVVSDSLWPCRLLCPSLSPSVCSNSVFELVMPSHYSLSFTISQCLLRFLSIELVMPSHYSLSFTISQCLLKFLSIELVMLPDHLILCHPLLVLPSIFPSIRVFPSESALHTRWPK